MFFSVLCLPFLRFKDHAFGPQLHHRFSLQGVGFRRAVPWSSPDSHWFPIWKSIWFSMIPINLKRPKRKMQQESNQSNSNWGCGLFAVDLWWFLWHAVWPELFPAETCRNHQQLGMNGACFTVSRWSSRRVAASLLPQGKQRPVYAESPGSVKTRLKLVDPYWTTCIYTDSHQFRVPLQRPSLHLWWLAHTSSLKWVWWFDEWPSNLKAALLSLLLYRDLQVTSRPEPLQALLQTPSAQKRRNKSKRANA